MKPTREKSGLTTIRHTNQEEKGSWLGHVSGVNSRLCGLSEHLKNVNALGSRLRTKVISSAGFPLVGLCMSFMPEPYLIPHKSQLPPLNITSNSLRRIEVNETQEPSSEGPKLTSEANGTGLVWLSPTSI